MRPRRFTLVYAMIAIAGTALALAALRGSSNLWSIATLLATLGLLAWATLGAVLLRGSERSPWLGIAIFGWLFFAIVYTKPIFVDFRTWIHEGLIFLGERVHPDPLLLESPVGSDPDERLLPPNPPRFPGDGRPPISPAEEASIRVRLENDSRLARTRALRSNFSATLLLLVNVAFALIGGLAGRFFATRISESPPRASQIGYNRVEETP